MNYVASQYALAAFSLAGEKKKWKEFKAEWDQVVSGLDFDTLKFFQHPGISKVEKKRVIDSTLTDDLVKHLFFVLIDNRRLDLLNQISIEYSELLNKMNQTLEVTVFSKQPLSDSQKIDFTQRLSESHHRDIKLINIVDSSIIAGYRYAYEGFVVDETINRQLDNLKSHLKK